MRKFKLNYLFILILMIVLGTTVISMEVKAEEAVSLPVNVTISNGSDASVIRDGSYKTSVYLQNGDTITVKSDTPISGMYLIWDAPVAEWTLKYNDKEITQGTNGFLHDYITFEGVVTEFSICTAKSNRLADIYCYGAGDLPADVQVWEPMCEKADILLYSTHADDEILFFGSILPEYAMERDLEVQVVYFSQYWTGAKIREHEKLDGLWHAGVRNYPYNADFDDLYSTSFEQACNIFGYEKALDFTVGVIRKFKPQVVIAQDLNGEYGHGTHMFTAKITTEAIMMTNDASKYPESAQLYGTHEVKKTYLHLYGENKIKLPTRVPLDSFGGKTALEVAQESYKYHVSQQWCWFYVDDEYEYSCADFGLFHSTVGLDTGNDIMENIVDYKTQKAEEEEKLRQEEESRRQEEESKRQEAESISEAESIKESQSIAAEESKQEAEKKEAQERKLVTTLIVVAVSLSVVAIVIIIILKNMQSKKRRKKRRVK